MIESPAFVMEISEGDNKSYIITFPDGTDLTGCKVYFYAKEDLADADGAAKISKTITDHSAPTNANKTTLVIAKTDTEDLNVTGDTDYYAAIKMIDASGKPTTYGSKGRGILRVLAPVIQATL